MLKKEVNEIKFKEPYILYTIHFDLSTELTPRILSNILKNLRNLECLSSCIKLSKTTRRLIIEGEKDSFLSKQLEIDLLFFSPDYYRSGRFCRFKLKRFEIKKYVIFTEKGRGIILEKPSIYMTLYDCGVGELTIIAKLCAEDGDAISTDELIEVLNNLLSEQGINSEIMVPQNALETFLRTADPTHPGEKDALTKIQKSSFLKGENITCISNLSLYQFFKLIRNWLIEIVRGKRFSSYKEFLTTLRNRTNMIIIGLIIHKLEPKPKDLSSLVSSETFRRQIYGIITRDKNWRIIDAERVFNLISPNLSCRRNSAMFLGFDSYLLFYLDPRYKIDNYNFPLSVIRAISSYNIVRFVKYALWVYNNYLLSTARVKKPEDVARLRELISRYIDYYYSLEFLDESASLAEDKIIIEKARELIYIRRTYNILRANLDQLDRRISIIHSRATERALTLLNIIVSGTIAFALIDKVFIQFIPQPITTWLYLPAWFSVAVVLYLVTRIIHQRLVQEALRGTRIRISESE